ncbi:MAG: AraC family transcriptional regulator [Sphaerochaetaceae bacterium]|nr:AraC family transcriptional regulator [Sphaerochaetaceae bacterium]
MKVNEKGVLKESEVFFHNPSQLSKKLFFNLICCGNFTCNRNYKVKRNTYHSYLLIYVLKGNGYVKEDDKNITISENSLTILDCNIPHEYGTNIGWKILWIHFNGARAKDWFNLINEKKLCYKKIYNSLNVINTIEEIINCLKFNKANIEILINKYIVSLLSEFIIENEGDNNTNPFNSIMGYINNNLDKKITIEDLAKRACMSKYHFIRKFSKEVGYTPYEFILNSRINASKYYLTTTNKPIKEIFFLCGFKDSSAFSTAFKKVVNQSPSEFRQINKT